MKRYSDERKSAVLKKLLPPMNMTVMEVAKQEGISDVTLYAWRKQVRAEGMAVLNRPGFDGGYFVQVNSGSGAVFCIR